MRRFAFLACPIALSVVLTAQSTGIPDLVLLNGRVYTVEAARPWAEAVAIAGERILAVGTSTEMRALAGPRTRTIDLRGAFVAPGFNDAHVHIDSTGSLLVGVNLLDVYERVLTGQRLVDSDHRWRVIHAQVVHPDDFPRFGRLKLVAEVNPYHVSDDMRWMEERIGSERSRGAYAFRRLKDAGAVLVFGSDSPGTNAARYFLNPVYGLYAAVSRQTLAGEPKEGWFRDQRLTIEEAIEAYTRNSAWASFEEHLKGTLTAGKLADLAVFDTNLVEAGRTTPATLLRAKVLYTIVGGRIVHEATPRPTAADARQKSLE